jgi:transcriptional regulator with XRE-family HTH domain
MAEPSILGKRIKAFRLRAGLSQNRLSALSGVPRATIINVESGQQESVSLESATRLADALGISIDMLVRGDVLEEKDSELVAATV